MEVKSKIVKREIDINAYMEQNKKLHEKLFEPYNPITGRGSYTCERKPFKCRGITNGEILIPSDCFEERIIERLNTLGSVRKYLKKLGLERTETNVRLCIEQYAKARCRHDFEFWCATCVYIKDRNTENDILFILNKGQRKALKQIYDDDKNGVPVRNIFLKSRQNGISTMVQMYMGWKQLVVIGQWHSVICAHIENTARVIRGMYTKMLKKYPSYMLNNEKPLELTPFENSQKTRIVNGVGCRITIGSAEKPDGIVGDNISMAHFSEVGLYKTTEGKTPKQLVQSIVSGIAYKENTFIAYESTARGVGNFFYEEWQRAIRGESAFKPFFLAWFEFEDNMMRIKDYPKFIKSLSEYEQMLFGLGATLEHLMWRRNKIKEYSDEWRFMMEFPSTPDEAFQSTGRRFYPLADVVRLRKGVRKPIFVGDIYGKQMHGQDATKDLKFREETNGYLKIWEFPEEEKYTDRYVVVVDIGGLSEQSDRSVICVIDRKDMAKGGVPSVVAEWCGHIDHDLLAWKAVQIATAYQEALLIIESNTLESEQTEGDHFEFILDEIAYHYGNLFCRTSADKIKEGIPPRWGFHTNKSSKQMVCNHHKKVLRENLYNEPCEEAVNEHDTFEIKQNGSLGAVDGAHDDRHITRAIGIWACYQYLNPPKKCNPHNTTYKKQKLQGLSSF